MKLSNFYDLVIDKDVDKIIQIFGNHDLSFNTPIEGEIASRQELQNYVNRFSKWFEKEDLQIEMINQVSTYVYTAIEFVITGGIELPIALVAEFEDGTISSIRDYHSMWPLEGEHRIRSPFLPPGQGLTIPDPVSKYMRYLEEGDTDQIIALFSDDAYFREPSGSEYKYQGKNELEKLYTEILSDGGIDLTHCTAIEEDGTAVIEFIAKRWGKTKLEPQAGVACYDFEDNKLTAARVYDDVNPPL